MYDRSHATLVLRLNGQRHSRRIRFFAFVDNPGEDDFDRADQLEIGAPMPGFRAVAQVGKEEPAADPCVDLDPLNVSGEAKALQRRRHPPTNVLWIKPSIVALLGGCLEAMTDPCFNLRTH